MSNDVSKTGAVVAGLNPVTAVGSTTTQNVAGGIGITVTGIAGLVAFIRATWPQAIPWPVDQDLVFGGLVLTFFAPLATRVFAFLRDRYKVK